VELSTAQGASHSDAANAVTYTLHREDNTGKLVVADGTNSWTIDGTTNKINFDTGEVTLVTADNPAALPGSGFTALTSGKYISENGSTAVSVDLSDVTTDLGGTNKLFKSDDGSHVVQNTDADGKVTYYAAKLDEATGKVTTQEEVMVDPLSAIDDALQQVDDL